MSGFHFRLKVEHTLAFSRVERAFKHQRLVLARALLAQGDAEGAKALVREAWRHDSMSADVESQGLKSHADLLPLAHAE